MCDFPTSHGNPFLVHQHGFLSDFFPHGAASLLVAIWNLFFQTSFLFTQWYSWISQGELLDVIFNAKHIQQNDNNPHVCSFIHRLVEVCLNTEVTKSFLNLLETSRLPSNFAVVLLAFARWNSSSAGDALRFGQPLGSWVTDQMKEMDVDFRGRVGVVPLLGQFQHV